VKRALNEDNFSRAEWLARKDFLDCKQRLKILHIIISCLVV